jgi:hypothetical protein
MPDQINFQGFLMTRKTTAEIFFTTKARNVKTRNKNLTSCFIYFRGWFFILLI